MYGYSTPAAPVEVINLRVSARGVTEKPVIESYPQHGPDPSAARTGYREIWFDAGYANAAVYDGLQLFNGNVVPGPAIVVQPTTTILVPPDFELTCDAGNNYLMYRKGADVGDLVRQLGGEANQ